MATWLDSCRIPNLHAMSGGLKVAELPAGILTGARALKLMGVPVKVRHAYDLESFLSRQSMAGFSHEDQSHMHWGPIIGDLLQLSPEMMEIVHILLSGPCCPPWSKLGTKGHSPRFPYQSRNYLLKWFNHEGGHQPKPT
jgi:hypothetical protein